MSSYYQAYVAMSQGRRRHMREGLTERVILYLTCLFLNQFSSLCEYTAFYCREKTGYFILFTVYKGEVQSGWYTIIHLVQIRGGGVQLWALFPFNTINEKLGFSISNNFQEWYEIVEICKLLWGQNLLLHDKAFPFGPLKITPPPPP